MQPIKYIWDRGISDCRLSHPNRTGLASSSWASQRASSSGSSASQSQVPAPGKKKGLNMWSEYIAVDIAASPSRPNSMNNCLPCLTSCRAAWGPPFITKLGRQLSTSELLRAQGFDPEIVRCNSHLSKRQLGAAIGTAITLPVLRRSWLRFSRRCRRADAKHCHLQQVQKRPARSSSETILVCVAQFTKRIGTPVCVFLQSD